MKIEDLTDEIIPPKGPRRDRFGAWLDSDKKTTALACLLGALISSKVNFGKVLRGDPDEIGLVIAAVVIVAFGYLTNKLPTIKP